jgi:hypothetical protein
MRTFLFDFGAGVAGVGRHCVELSNPDEISHGENNENNMCFAAACRAASSHTRDDARTADRNAVARLGNRQGEALNF